MSPVEATPLQTAAPALVAAVMLMGCLLASRRDLLPPRRFAAALLAICGVALVVRLGVLPAFERHVFDGHEAEYWDLFRGERALSRGGTVLYPAMQWWWWSLGRLLPHDPRIPVFISALVAAGGVASLGAAVGRLAGPVAGGVAAAVLALHPVHAAWSSSAYNVILPWSLGALALLACAALAQPRAGLERRHALALGGVAGAALALVVATRLDAALWCLPCAAVLLSPGRTTLRQRLPALVGLGAGALLAGLAAWPLLFPGEVPGAGERGLSFAINVGLLSPHAPFDTGPALALLVLGTVLAARRWPLLTVVLVGTTVLNHLILASFDDFGDRHALTGLVGVVWALGAGAVAVPGPARRLGGALALGGLLVAASGLPPLATTFYGTEEAFAASLEQGPFAELPRHPLSRVDTVVAPPGQCGWIAEDHRVARDPIVSHFNVITPQEEASLRGADGCLRWCADVQDWRWSSRGVRDRAARLHHLFETRPVGVVVDEASGYSCAVWQLGERRQ